MDDTIFTYTNCGALIHKTASIQINIRQLEWLHMKLSSKYMHQHIYYENERKTETHTHSLTSRAAQKLPDKMESTSTNMKGTISDRKYNLIWYSEYVFIHFHT